MPPKSRWPFMNVWSSNCPRCSPTICAASSLPSPRYSTAWTAAKRQPRSSIGSTSSESLSSARHLRMSSAGRADHSWTGGLTAWSERAAATMRPGGPMCSARQRASIAAETSPLVDHSWRMPAPRRPRSTTHAAGSAPPCTSAGQLREYSAANGHTSATGREGRLSPHEVPNSTPPPSTPSMLLSA